MTSEFKETFSKSPSQNDSSTHDSLKLMPNLNVIPEHLPVHLFSFSLLVPSRITLKFKLQRSLLRRNIFIFVYKLIYPIFVKVLVNCSRDNGVKLIRASEHICLFNSKDWRDTLGNCGRWCGVCFVRLFPVSHRIMFYFFHYISDLTQNQLPYFVPY